ncbi:YihY/virulence factor BrkB family protein [Hydrogenimonas cancrithermarum]|uniref:YihY/virulence factor BrkB family protein n=1 Tax=Hydrogenimonas cancrithermarum TaxID=2993563 RepID=UPI0025729FA9|nr:YihY family inner membrane protein [Hydrogenimonas cancrithermarum]
MRHKTERLIKTIYCNLKRFYDPDIPYYAASLSFYTIFTIIPLLLISFSIIVRLPNFSEQYEKIKSFIFSNIMPASHDTVAQYIDTFLANTSKLGVIGFIFIMIASILFFQNYEYIVGKIFKSKQKGFWNALTTYWTLITLGPMGLAASIYLSVKIQQLLNQSSYTNSIDFLALFPYLIIWMLFFVTYKISTTVVIKFKAALISSFFASLIWYIGKNLFIYYTVHNKTYATIYGSFSTLLFFMLWIYVSWIIFLYGQKLCYLLNQVKEPSERKPKLHIECDTPPDGGERNGEEERKEP